MTKKFKFLRVSSQAELDRYGVREFAAEFGHKPIGLPIILLFFEDDLVAYFEVRQTPVLHPAIHPKVSPRTFLEGGLLVAALMREQFENGLIIYDRRSAHFAPEAMEHIGFELSPFKYFQTTKEAPDGS